MTIREHAPAHYLRAYAWFLLFYGLLYTITLYLGKFVDAAWDTRLLLWSNPDSYIPILEEAVILQTDFGTYFLVLVLVAWQIGYALSADRPERKEFMRRLFQVLAVVFGLWHAVGIAIHGRGVFWWGAYTHPLIFLPLGAAFFAAFWAAGDLYTRLDEDDQKKLAHAFWLTMLALFFTNVLGEDVIKATMERHRPLHAVYESWNHQVRILPDEVVRGSYSYISGHASTFFAKVGVYFWLVKCGKLRVFLLLWAGFHAFTRMYTAAHFPKCAIMGALFGFVVASLIYFFLWNHRNMPFIASLALGCSLFFLLESPAIPTAIVAVVICWQIVYWFLHRQDFDTSPDILDNEICC